ncbi:disulfide bond formation protein B [Candidatus Curtissbacteria bacterium]|nr:disulfide bond formation protein B [Candidatus Curtissbacteria bacterium]
MVRFIKNNALYIAFVQAWFATLGSLYFSEIRHWIPCILCWYQRILMYPLIIILGVAIWRKDKNVAYYVLPMTILGASIAFYHYMLQMTPLKEITPVQCKAYGPCSEVKALTFFNGAVTLPYFVTIPFLSFTAFIVITIMMIVILKTNKKNENRK